MSPADGSGVDPAWRVFVSYIDKTREFYAAQGYGTPYRWAYNTEVPFAPLAKPLAQSRVGVVTTSSIDIGQEAMDLADRPPKRAYTAPAHPIPSRQFTMDLAWDKDATHTDDVDTFLPLRRLDEFVAEGRIGSASPRFYGVPTEYSQRKTTTIDAPDILQFCREDGVDVVVLAGL